MGKARNQLDAPSPAKEKGNGDNANKNQNESNTDNEKNGNEDVVTLDGGQLTGNNKKRVI